MREPAPPRAPDGGGRVSRRAGGASAARRITGPRSGANRDTGRSTWAFDTAPYAIRDLADDVVRLLDELGVERAHLVGASMGGMLVQLLMLDYPDRVLSATMYADVRAWLRPTAGGRTFVVEGPADPVNPPPHAQHLASLLGSARVVTIPGLGHATSRFVVDPLADAILGHTAEVDARQREATA